MIRSVNRLRIPPFACYTGTVTNVRGCVSEIAGLCGLATCREAWQGARAVRVALHSSIRSEGVTPSGGTVVGAVHRMSGLRMR